MDAADYRDLLLGLLPPGDALTRDPESDLGRLLWGLAGELARIDARLEQLLAEVDPRTTTELLADWERVLGIPHCGATVAPTLAARRSEILARLTLLGNLTPAFLEQALALSGFTVSIVERDPLEFGSSQFGDELAGPAAWWTFDAVTPDAGVFEAEFGAVAFGEPLGSIGNDRLACLLDALKPAHTAYRIVLETP